jgi:nucleotide-binding universal stress UspA family protein
MKTILVLTDFSINAEYTAYYALKFAQKINANLLLCNIYALPPGKERKALDVWPKGPYESNSNNDLGEITARLKTELDKGDKGDFRPEIDQYSKEGLVIDTVNDIVSTHHILMAIISMHSGNFLETLISGNHVIDIIEKATVPVLIIPYQVRFRDYKTIAFATDLTLTDIDVLRSLSTLAKYTGSDILITHVADKNNNLSREEEEFNMKQFFNQSPLKINNPGVRYHAIKSSSTTTGLKELTQEIETDMLVLIRRENNVFQKIFENNVIRNLADHPAKPLLIFPSSNLQKKLPVF